MTKFGALSQGEEGLTWLVLFAVRFEDHFGLMMMMSQTGSALEKVSCPVLLIVGGRDHGVIELNEKAFHAMKTKGLSTLRS
jgi:hypothetical protein